MINSQLTLIYLNYFFHSVIGPYDYAFHTATPYCTSVQELQAVPTSLSSSEGWVGSEESIAEVETQDHFPVTPSMMIRPEEWMSQSHLPEPNASDYGPADSSIPNGRGPHLMYSTWGSHATSTDMDQVKMSPSGTISHSPTSRRIKTPVDNIANCRPDSRMPPNQIVHYNRSQEQSTPIDCVGYLPGRSVFPVTNGNVTVEPLCNENEHFNGGTISPGCGMGMEVTSHSSNTAVSPSTDIKMMVQEVNAVDNCHKKSLAAESASTGLMPSPRPRNSIVIPSQNGVETEVDNFHERKSSLSRAPPYTIPIKVDLTLGDDDVLAATAQLAHSLSSVLLKEGRPRNEQKGEDPDYSLEGLPSGSSGNIAADNSSMTTPKKDPIQKVRIMEEQQGVLDPGRTIQDSNNKYWQPGKNVQSDPKFIPPLLSGG